LRAEEIRDWYQQKRRPELPESRVMELYFTFHPRTAFLKTLPADAVVADIGAGDGSLSSLLGWPSPARRDIRLHAYALEKGALFDRFESFEIGDWNAAPPEFSGRRFDALLCAHFIEHIGDPASFIAWAARKLVPGGRVYLEWPSPASLELPPVAELKALGVDIMISRFDDDSTHRDLPATEDVVTACARHGLVVEGRGIVRLPWIEEEMLAHFRNDKDPFPRQAAFWSRTGWSQYLLLRQPD